MADSYWRRIESTYSAGLSRTDADLLRYLIHRADFKTGRAYPGFRRILKDLAMGLRTFLIARDSLRTAGHLTWVQRRIAGRQNDTTEYQLSPQWWVLNDTQGVGAKRHRKHTTTRKRLRIKPIGSMQCASCRRVTHNLYDGHLCQQCARHANVLLFPEARK